MPAPKASTLAFRRSSDAPVAFATGSAFATPSTFISAGSISIPNGWYPPTRFPEAPDFFHDSEARVASAFAADRGRLRHARYAVEV